MSAAAGITTTTQIHRNPFFLLRASTRDNRRRILELADEHSLQLSEDECQKARSELTTPRQRLAAEIAWLPGVSPRKAKQLIETLEQQPLSLRTAAGLPVLAHLNLLAATLETESQAEPDEIADFIVELSSLVDELDSEVVVRDINEDRAISGFSDVKGVDQVEDDLIGRKRYYRNSIKGALDRVPPNDLVGAMTAAVDNATHGGEKHAPELIDGLVDAYEVEIGSFLEKEADNIKRLIAAVNTMVGSGEHEITPLIHKIELTTRNWDRVAQPVQLSSKSRGIDHDPSRSIAYQIRGLSIGLCNEHDFPEQAARLTKLLLDLFSEIPDVHERVVADQTALSQIAQRRNESSAIDPIWQLCKEVAETSDHYPDRAGQQAARLLSDGAELLKSAPIAPTSPTYQKARDIIAATLMHCAVSYGNETSRWQTCISLLQSALSQTDNETLRKRISSNLKTVRANHESLGDLEPIKSVPSLHTVNGVGATLYGSTESKPDGSYMATHYFTFFFIPIFPLARYRVIPTGNGYRFLGKGPLRDLDKWHIAIMLGIFAIVIFNF